MRNCRHNNVAPSQKNEVPSWCTYHVCMYLADARIIFANAIEDRMQTVCDIMHTVPNEYNKPCFWCVLVKAGIMHIPNIVIEVHQWRHLHYLQVPNNLSLYCCDVHLSCARSMQVCPWCIGRPWGCAGSRGHQNKRDQDLHHVLRFRPSSLPTIRWLHYISERPLCGTECLGHGLSGQGRSQADRRYGSIAGYNFALSRGKPCFCWCLTVSAKVFIWCYGGDHTSLVA